jgi:tRNA A37 threonylcarbamoyladenosine dehydratase
MEWYILLRFSTVVRHMSLQGQKFRSSSHDRLPVIFSMILAGQIHWFHFSVARTDDAIHCPLSKKIRFDDQNHDFCFQLRCKFFRELPRSTSRF